MRFCSSQIGGRTFSAPLVTIAPVIVIGYIRIKMAFRL